MIHSKSLPIQHQTRQADCVLPGCYAASNGNFSDVSRQAIGPFFKEPIGPIFNLVEETDRLSRNVGKELPFLAAWQTRRTHFSSTSRGKTEITHKTVYVRITWQSSAFARPLLTWKRNMCYRFWVCVCSLSHTACNSHAPYRHLWPALLYNIFRWSRGTVLAFSTQVRGFKPGRSRRIFWGEKILSTPSFGGEVKPSVPCRRFSACKRYLNLRGSRNLGKITGNFLAHSSTFRC